MNQRGSILLEVLLAIAVFTFAGIVILGVLEETVAAGGRAERRALAMDLARTRMAEIEAGVEGDSAADGSASSGASTAFAAPAASSAASGTSASALPDPRKGLRVEVRLEPSDHPGLALAVVEVWDDAAQRRTALAQALGDSSSDPPRLAVLRQLVKDASGAPAAPVAPRPEFKKPAGARP